MKVLSTVTALITLVQAGLRFPCSTLTVQRLDPAGEPGQNPSSHVHHIVGGNAFNVTMTGDHPTNGSYHRVTPLPVQPLLGGSDGAQGGLTVYYTQFDLNRDNLKQQPVKSFPPQTVYRRCWDGKNLDSPDHQSHTYNTVNTDYFNNAPACPASHPVRVPQVTFETTWDTTKFNSMWPSGAPNPFVWSFEGNSYGTHADYMFGWKGDALQRAMDKSECFYDGCGSIQKQSMATANKCQVQDMVGEQTDGWLSKLPGMAM
ncbi:hypothetical protein E0Z10_g6034 [Xylaria hypoxylon]|uniref:DUF1996 domain-containing protein n=1 Tax=Xylaria hypoxylon TaxID=37992 RepID=A0A4Z0YUB6_9PEZI|nr:hypothetical protein E0Z10_g6034 [Xylaria hypoxylon]